jgi:hypothetical protein
MVGEQCRIKAGIQSFPHEMQSLNWIPVSPAFAGVTAGMTGKPDHCNDIPNDIGCKDTNWESRS